MSRKLIPIGVVSVTLAVTLLFAYARTGVTSQSSSHTAEVAENQSRERVEAELLVLRAEGFHPSEIKRPRGRFLLALQNHSDAEEISLELRQEAGASSRQIRLTKKQSKLKEFIDLPPGRYLLVETNHPEWICRIIIED